MWNFLPVRRVPRAPRMSLAVGNATLNTSITQSQSHPHLPGQPSARSTPSPEPRAAQATGQVLQVRRNCRPISYQMFLAGASLLAAGSDCWPGVVNS
jgi:hypothetical protein